MDTASGASKGDLARYYTRVAERFLRYAKDRPIALLRCPQGDARPCFFQKHAMPGLDDSVHTATVAAQQVLWVDGARGLYELVQFNTVEFHGWGARRPKLGKPDWMIFDLDPDAGLPFARVVDAAFELREILARIGLQSFVKTTGGKGLHVVVPLAPRSGWDRVAAFSRHVAETLAGQQPQHYVATMSKAQRVGRIFIDYLRNGRGATAVLPYSCRARPGATVAVPLAWKDLRTIDPREFHIGNVGQWLGTRRADPWAELASTVQRLPGLSAVSPRKR